MKRPLVDSTGHSIDVGDKVRVLCVPDLSGMPDASRADTEAVFRHLRGTVRRVREIDERSCAVLIFRIRAGENAGLHIVGIEGAHLKKQGSPSHKPGPPP